MVCTQVAVGALVLAVLCSVAVAIVMVEAPTDLGDVRTLVVDTDAGADDAMAILELLMAERRDGHVKTLAITCVHGNTGVENVTKNVLATLKIADRLDVPVYSGAAAALLPPQLPPTDYFGTDGFGDFLAGTAGLPDPKQYVREEPAAVALVRLARENPGQVTLVCVGPLTNVALAVRLDPSFLDNLRDVYVLGGAARGNGNAAPGVEFNVQADPAALAVLLDAVKTPIYLMPWETVLEAEVSVDWRVRVLGNVNSLAVRFLNYAEAVSLANKSPTWTSGDGLLAALLVDPAVASVGSPVHIQVLVGEGPGRGVTLVDHSNTTGLPANALLLEGAYPDRFKELLLTLLS